MRIRTGRWHSKVLAILRRRAGPLSAYDILAELRETHKKVAPVTVYRALAALTERGEVHRLESLSAYIVCQCAAHQHASILSICDHCGLVEEKVAPDLLARLSSVIRQTGFAPKRHVIEVHGRCGACNAEGAPT